MTAATPTDGAPSPESITQRHEASDGTVFWGDVSAERFEAACDEFPVLKFVIEEYFGSPEKPGRDSVFLAQYAEVGEDSAEYAGFMDDLTAAIRKYQLATPLIDGLMGATLSPAEVRTNLVSLKDQLLEQGAFSPVDIEDERKRDPLLVDSTDERLKSSFLRQREIPFGPWKGRTFPMYMYLLASLALVLIGLGITYIPYVGKVGFVFILVGGVGAFVFAIAMLSMRSDFNHPEVVEAREEARRESEEKKAARKQRGGFMSRINPFSN